MKYSIKWGGGEEGWGKLARFRSRSEFVANILNPDPAK